jgi:hypothetical protein
LIPEHVALLSSGIKRTDRRALFNASDFRLVTREAPISKDSLRPGYLESDSVFLVTFSRLTAFQVSYRIRSRMTVQVFGKNARVFLRRISMLGVGLT